MKKINLKGIKEILNEKELKNVMGGSSYPNGCNSSCSGSCRKSSGGVGNCRYTPFSWACGCF